MCYSYLSTVRHRNVPLSILVIGSVLWLCGLLDGTFPIMFTSGLFVAWVYLRFYQPHGSNSRGDSSDSFTFARYDFRPLCARFAE